MTGGAVQGEGEDMSEEKENQIIYAAARHYGRSQITKTIEECAELITALSREDTDRRNISNIYEEMADVEIMLDQLKIVFESGKIAVQDWKRLKLERLERRLTKDGVQVCELPGEV